MAWTNIFALRPPYDTFEHIETSWLPEPLARGVAVVWFVSEAALWSPEFEWIKRRPRGLACALVLPPPEDIPLIAPIVARLPEVEPNAVLPSGRIATPGGIKASLSGAPRSLARSVSNYLWKHELIRDLSVRAEIYKIFHMAPRITTISRLCREMYLSRRTLGRHFEAHGLPVPSHWLQFARLLHVLLRAQSDRSAVCRLAIAAGYPDGFTFSNQVKRLVGMRPSETRNLIGFEWLIEAWLAREKRRGEPSESFDEVPDK